MTHVQRLLDAPPSFEIFTEAESLYNYFGTDHIQASQKTGRHYRARIRFAGDSAGKRCPLGFIILSADSSTQKVDEAIRQAERPHTLLSQGRILEWPANIVSLDYALFDKS